MLIQVRLLIEKGADASIKDNEGQTAHDYAKKCESNYNKMTELLDGVAKKGSHVKRLAAQKANTDRQR